MWQEIDCKMPSNYSWGDKNDIYSKINRKYKNEKDNKYQNCITWNIGGSSCNALYCC